jgi:hypothetical protein
MIRTTVQNVVPTELRIRRFNSFVVDLSEVKVCLEVLYNRTLHRVIKVVI